MQIRVLDKEDGAGIESCLLARFPGSLPVLQVTRELKGRLDEANTPVFVGLTQEQALIGLVAQLRNGRVYVESDSHVNALVDMLTKESNTPVTGLFGKDDVIRDLTQLRMFAQCTTQLNEKRELFILDLKKLALPAKLAGGQFSARKLEPSDLPVYAHWLVQYNVEIMRAKTSPELKTDARHFAETALSADNTWILEENEQMRAVCGVSAKQPEGALLSTIWTPPEYRNRQYGRCLIASVLYDLWLRRCAYALVFIPDRAAAAKHLITSLGFESSGAWRLVIFSSPVRPA